MPLVVPAVSNFMSYVKLHHDYWALTVNPLVESYVDPA